ncbi:MAG: DUF3300 domain-containing protein [Acidobacteriaceae bacterium]
MWRLAPALAEAGKRSVALLLVWLMIPLGIASTTAFAQQVPPPPPDQQGAPPPDQGAPPPDQDDQGAPPTQWQALSPQQLNELAAPIALYPDSLVAQILAAATYPTQVVDADRFVQSNQGAPPDQLAQMVNGQNWDPSVKALTAFPSVLSNMDKNLDWTTQLGNAYYNQPQDVMNAVQGLRQQAYQQGHLQSTPQLNVSYQPDDIVIAPANPSVVYVPYYNPWSYWGFQPYYAWYAPPPPPGFAVGVRFGFGFGIGVAVGAWGGWGWGWGHWGFAWGAHPYVAFNRVTYVSRSVTVVNHGYYGRFDRNPAARSYNIHAAASVRTVNYNHVTEINNNRSVNNYSRTNNVNRTNNNYNRTNNNYNRTTNNNYRSPTNNYRAPANNNSRPAQNYNRGNANTSRGTQNYNRPAQNRSNTNNRGNQGRPAGNEKPHNEGHPQNKGGDKGEHPHGR